jgi:hypothetical protein
VTIVAPIYAAFFLLTILLSVSFGGNEQEEPMRFEPSFTLADIENIIIENIMDERGRVKVDPRHFPSIYEGLKTSTYPRTGEVYECEPTRKASIQLKNGSKYSMTYHVQCNAPEYFLQKPEEEKAVRLFNFCLKKTLMALELPGLKVRFVRMQKHGHNNLVVISSVTANAHLGGTTSGLNDGKGQLYELKGERTEDGRVELLITVTHHMKDNSKHTDERKSELNKTFLLGPQDLNVEGSSHVVSSTPEEILLLICEPQLL